MLVHCALQLYIHQFGDLGDSVIAKYNSITDDNPYVCMFCFKAIMVKQLSKLKSCIEDLMAEVTELRTALALTKQWFLTW